MPLPMTPNCHRVQRQVIDLSIGAGAEAPAVQAQLARPFWDRAVPELEEVFDRAAGPSQRLRLDRLEIDLGRIEGVDWTTEFRRKLVAELARTLADVSAAPEARHGNAPRDRASAAPWEPFLFFLVHGRLPWWSAAPRERWTEAIVDDSDTAGWHALQETLAKDRSACVRLIHAVTDEFLDRAVRRWSGLPHSARVFDQLTPAPLRGDARHRWRRAFWMSVLDWGSAGASPALRSGPTLLRDLLVLRHTHHPNAEQRAPFQGPSSDAPTAGLRPRFAPTEELPGPWREWQQALADADTIEPGAAERPADPDRPIGDAPHQHRPREGAARDRGRPVVDEDAIYLGGAGAVLLHPFLEPLFRERGLLAGRTFRDDDARKRAVHLLSLLTFGRVDVAEYELLLPKLLCGVRFDEPLEPVSLEDDEIAACDALLRAVLEHWTALRSSSPEWLRQQFFLRDAKLEPVDGGYRLTIERRAQDVLLGRLPWGLGAIALPWLGERIFVRWLE